MTRLPIPPRNSPGLIGTSALMVAVFWLTGCSSDSSNAPPIAESTTVTVREDSVASGQLIASDPEGKPVSYVLIANPEHGMATIDAATGAFTYEPVADFNGTDRFLFGAIASGRKSAAAAVDVTIEPVNDVPSLAPMMPLMNSPESEVLRYKVPLTDVDGDPLTLSATNFNSNVARVEVIESTLELQITQLDYGTTKIFVSGSDGEYVVSGEVTYSVDEVSKSRTFWTSIDSPSYVNIANNSKNNVRFVLRHNDKRLETSIQSMLESIGDMSAKVPAESFERKMWRYVRDNVYHGLPISANAFVHDPLTLINSIGWGLCDDAAIAYVHLARASGREARVWYLEGHVVPEIKVDGTWQMYDPDLFVYYFNQNLLPASVDDLARMPSLITSPLAPIFKTTSGLTAYSMYLADIYASTADNRLAEEIVPALLTPVSPIGAEFELPPGATVTYPGIWAPKPIGYDGDASEPAAVVANLRLEFPAGWVGTIRLPLLLAAIYGTGQFSVDNVLIDGDSYEVTDSYYGRQAAPQEISILESSSPISIVMLLNPLRFSMTEWTKVQVRSRDAWALDISTLPAAPQSTIDVAALAAVRKPTP